MKSHAVPVSNGFALGLAVTAVGLPLFGPESARAATEMWSTNPGTGHWSGAASSMPSTGDSLDLNAWFPCDADG